MMTLLHVQVGGRIDCINAAWHCIMLQAGGRDLQVEVQ
jgi:hypothetical protein